MLLAGWPTPEASSEVKRLWASPTLNAHRIAEILVDTPVRGYYERYEGDGHKELIINDFLEDSDAAGVKHAMYIEEITPQTLQRIKEIQDKVDALLLQRAQENEEEEEEYWSE